MSAKSITWISRVSLLACSVMLLSAVFLPIWRIELSAPQYPEGLLLLIYASKLGGDVEIINGLNHYIGMQTLHAEDFIEFTVLPYILVGFASLVFASFVLGRKRMLYLSTALFICFGILSMVDFWYWEYNYGHNLDPKAAIIVPGMAYQPPLIGYKELLNFGAYSIPASGGWLLLGAGILLFITSAFEARFLSRVMRKRPGSVSRSTLVLLPLILLFGCVKPGPAELQANEAACAYCKMGIADLRFSVQAVSEKGRRFFFDDVQCTLAHQVENKSIEFVNLYVANYLNETEWIDSKQSVFVKAESLRSPMGGNIAAFKSAEFASRFNDSLAVLRWSDIEQLAP